MTSVEVGQQFNVFIDGLPDPINVAVVKEVDRVNGLATLIIPGPTKVQVGLRTELDPTPVQPPKVGGGQELIGLESDAPGGAELKSTPESQTINSTPTEAPEAVETPTQGTAAVDENVESPEPEPIVTHTEDS